MYAKNMKIIIIKIIKIKFVCDHFGTVVLNENIAHLFKTRHWGGKNPLPMRLRSNEYNYISKIKIRLKKKLLKTRIWIVLL